MNKGGIAIRLINLAKLITGRTRVHWLRQMLSQTCSLEQFPVLVQQLLLLWVLLSDQSKRRGYDPNFSAAVNIATAPTGLLIPPSNVMITYSLVSGGTSVAALFMAGYIPGILWGLACMLVIYIIAKKKDIVQNQHLQQKKPEKLSYRLCHVCF